VGDHERRKIERSGAFLGDGFGNAPVPIRTLSDEYQDTPEPQDSDRVPDPVPEGLATRAVRRVTRRGARQP